MRCDLVGGSWFFSVVPATPVVHTRAGILECTGGNSVNKAEIASILLNQMEADFRGPYFPLALFVCTSKKMNMIIRKTILLNNIKADSEALISVKRGHLYSLEDSQTLIY